MSQQQSFIMRKYICLSPRERKKLDSSLNSVPITEILSWSVLCCSASKQGKIKRIKPRSKPQCKPPVYFSLEKLVSPWTVYLQHRLKQWRHCLLQSRDNGNLLVRNTEKHISWSHYKPIFLIWFNFKSFHSCSSEAHNTFCQGCLSLSH